MTERLWAPWRMEFIEKKSSDGCVFCLATNDGSDLLIHKTENSTILLNKFPYNNGHLLIAPIRHTAELTELTKAEALDIHLLTTRSIKALREVMKPDGFNLGVNLGKAAGAGIADHIHYHIVPRWAGDINFMPAIGEVKVIPEHLEATRKKLIPFFT